MPRNMLITFFFQFLLVGLVIFEFSYAEGEKNKSSWWSPICGCGRNREEIEPPKIARNRSFKIAPPKESIPTPYHIPTDSAPAAYHAVVKSHTHTYNSDGENNHEKEMANEKPKSFPSEPPITPRVPVQPAHPIEPRVSPSLLQNVSPEQSLVSNRINTIPTPPVYSIPPQRSAVYSAPHTQHLPTENPNSERRSVRDMANHYSAMNLPMGQPQPRTSNSLPSNRFISSPTKSVPTYPPQRTLPSAVLSSNDQNPTEERRFTVKDKASQLQGMKVSPFAVQKSPLPSQPSRLLNAIPEVLPSKIATTHRAPPPPPRVIPSKGTPPPPPLPPPRPLLKSPISSKSIPLSREQASNNQFSHKNQQNAYQLPQKRTSEPPNYSIAADSRVTIDYNELPSVQQRSKNLDSLIRSGGFAFPQSRTN